MARFSSLPEEVLEEIMLRLPPESLREFKLVQKPWYLRISALMNDTKFVAKHLRNTKKKMLSSSSCRLSFLFMGDNERRRREKEEAEDDNVRQFLVLANGDQTDYDYIPCATDLLKNLKRYIDYRYCGLKSQGDDIITFGTNDTVMLLNPALREMKMIRCPSCYGNTKYCLRAEGFGFDSRANEYKVVAIAGRLNNAPSKAEVYSLRTNSWRKIRFDIEMPGISLLGRLYCGGVCYWYARGSATKMFCYDFSDEVFRDVPFPNWNQVSEGWLNMWKLSVWNESAAFLAYPDFRMYPMAIDVWVLDYQRGCGGATKSSNSWTKRLTIGPLAGIVHPIGFWNDDNLILRDGNGDVKLYHVGTRVLSHICDRKDCHYDDRFVIYPKSLVSVLRKEGKRSVVQQ